MAEILNGWGRGTGWGTLTFGEGTVPVAITGVSTGTTAVGSVSTISNNFIPVTMSAATGAINSLSLNAAANTSITGILGTTEITNLLVWGDIVPGQTTSYSEVSTSQTPNWEDIAA